MMLGRKINSLIPFRPSAGRQRKKGWKRRRRGDDGLVREERRRFPVWLAKNARLTEAISAELGTARQRSERTAGPARRFKDFTWSALDSGSRPRRVIGKAEWSGEGQRCRYQGHEERRLSRTRTPSYVELRVR